MNIKKIKIRSNPYAEQKEKCVSYQLWNISKQQWEDITDSDITQDKYTRKFFSLNADDIVEQLIKSYGSEKDNNAIEIEFEGTSDEFNDLNDLCKLRTENIILKKSERYYENARDIFGKIQKYFPEMRSIIEDHKRDDDTIKTELEKFSDVIKAEVPVCVMGNYSVGKSAFINALIGEELLPSSDDPTTAKIHKIRKSKYDDRAEICFSCTNEPYNTEVVLEFKKQDGKIEKRFNIPANNELFTTINTAFDSCTSNELVDKVNAILNVFNSSNAKELAEKISDIIEITIPFNKKSLLSSSDSDYLIIDTPGDDSAINAEHAEVVHKAMNNLSNGIPIYIATKTKIKSKSNKELCDEIVSLKELDSRFTMIIINMADELNSNVLNEMTEEDRENLKCSPVPSRLYSMGIYYVSSIIALGSKTGGKFRKPYDAWDDRSARYDESTSNKSRIVNLYAYNIMPKHLLEKAKKESASLSNRAYANSGMYCVEKDIEKFAMFYSPFNKCHQAKLFVDELHNKTQKVLEKKQEHLKCIKEELNSKLDNDKTVLINTIENECKKIIDDVDTDHNSHMDNYCSILLEDNTVSEIHITENKLKEMEASLKKDIEDEDWYKEVKKDQMNARNAVGDSLGQNVDFKSPLDAVAELGAKLGNMGEKEIQKYKANQEKDKQAAMKLFNEVNDIYKSECDIIEQKIYESSDSYWKQKVGETRNQLLDIVASMEGLSEEKQKELDNRIREYPNPTMPQISPFKDMEQFANNIFGLIRLNNDLNKKKLSKFYKGSIDEEIKSCKFNIHLKHMETFNEWLNILKGQIDDNIIELSKGLKRLQDDIDNKEKEFDSIKRESEALEHYKKRIDDLISLKSN